MLPRNVILIVNNFHWYYVTNYLEQSLSESLTIHLIHIIPQLYGTWRFITVITRDCH
jgi:hypothetical protein